MKSRALSLTWLAPLLVLAAVAAGTPAQAQESGWIMTLSWSPEYCQQNRHSDEPQCEDENYFVNFGLQAPDKAGDAHFGDACPHPHLAPDEENRWLWTIPNLERVRYVWAEQGACSGLDQQAFYAQMDFASRRVVVPEQYKDVERRLSTTPLDLKAAFVAANPEMTDASIALHCDAHWLSEVKICFDQDMRFQQCVVGSDCSQDIWMRPLRPDRRGPRPE